MLAGNLGMQNPNLKRSSEISGGIGGIGANGNLNAKPEHSQLSFSLSNFRAEGMLSPRSPNDNQNGANDFSTLGGNRKGGVDKNKSYMGKNRSSIELEGSRGGRA